MIANYVRPQLEINQYLQIILPTSSVTLTPLIVGPQFFLRRYAFPAEAALIPGTLFVYNSNPDPNGFQILPYQGGLQPNYVIDPSYTQVNATNLEAQYFVGASHVNLTDATLYDFEIPSLTQPNAVRVVRRGAAVTVTVGNSYSSGQIVSAAVIFGGSGYAVSSQMDVPVVGGTGTGAAVRLFTNASGVVTSATVISSGSGYTGSSVTFSAPSAAEGADVGIIGPTLIPDLFGRPVKVGDVVYVSFDGVTNRRTVKALQQEVSPATYGTDAANENQLFAPSLLNPTETDASTFGNTSAPSGYSVHLNDTTIQAITVSAGGSGYTLPPTVTISNPIAIGGSLAWPAQLAEATAVVAGGAVTAVNVNEGGGGYYNGSVVGVLITAGGSGYVAANPPAISVSSPPAGGRAASITPVISGGAITGYNIINPGSGYVTAPTLTLVGGAGSGATLVAVVNIGSVRGLTVTNPGLGYTSTANTVTVTGANTTGAVAAVASLQAVTCTLGTIVAGGSGFAVGDIIANTGGTLAAGGAQGTWKVLTVSAGAILTVQNLTPGNYTVLPTSTVTMLAVTGSGTGATQTITWGVNAAGTGSSVGDILTVTQGTLAPGGTAATFAVTSVNAGAILAVAPVNPGNYTSLHSNPVTVTTGGLGTGPFALNITWGIQTVTVSNPGSGYVVGQETTCATATIAGGGSSAYLVGDTLTNTGGTLAVGGAQGTWKVTAVSAGVVTAVQNITTGQYTVLPSNPVTMTGGTGSGTVTLTESFGISSGGSAGYMVNDVLTNTGGVLAPGGAQATWKVTSISAGGVVLAVSLITAGDYSTLPLNPVAVTGGAGTGAVALNETFGAASGAFSGMSAAPEVSFGTGTGGTVTVDFVASPTITLTPVSGGSGATATLVVNSYPTDWNGLVQGSIYNGQYAERYTITVVTAGTGVAGDTAAMVNIRSASGGFSANAVPLTHYGYGYIVDHPALGGLVADLRGPSSTSPLPLGSVFTFVVVGKYDPLTLTPTGEVTAVNILNGGTGYGNAVTLPITFSTPPAGGVIAAGTATSNSGGVIVSTNVTDPGSGYLSPPVATIAGAGTNAFFQSVIATAATSCDLALTAGSTYAGPANTRYLLKVLQGDNVGLTQNSFTGATLQVSDTAGIDVVQTYTGIQQGQNYPLGTYGLQFSLPTGIVGPSGLASGVTATGTLNFKIYSVSLGSSGTPVNYAVGDVVAFAAGTSTTAGSITITAVNGSGKPTGFAITNAGNYQGALPGLTSAGTVTTGGAGSGGLYLTFVWEALSVTMTNNGTGYVVEPAATCSNATLGLALQPVLENGVVYDTRVTSPGAGFVGTETITFSAPVSYQGGLRTGDVYYVNANAALADGPWSIIVLGGQAADITGWTTPDLALNLLNIDCRYPYTGLITPQRDTPPALAWTSGTAAQGGVILANNLDFYMTDRTSNNWVPFQASPYGLLFVTWRGLVPASLGTPITLYASEAAITSAFGVFDQDNPACYGPIMAYRGNQQSPVYAASVVTNDLAGYTAILSQAQKLDGAYAIALMTYDLATQELLEQHVDYCSLNNVREWRRGYNATQNPGSYSVLALNPQGVAYQASVLFNGFGNLRVVAPGCDFVAAGIQPGYLFRINYATDPWGNPTFNQYVVQSVTENDELLLVSGPASPISPPVNFQIWAPATGTAQAAYVGQVSESFGDRRVINVWCDTPMVVNPQGNLVPTPVYYLAAETAGLRCAVLPQQGLTYTQMLHSVTSCPNMYMNYAGTDLDLAASEGTWIVAQDQANGPVYIRHELTTNSSEGILYYEDMVGTNLDSISYQIRNLLQPYLGKRNANLETIEEISTKLRDLINGLMNDPGGFTVIGPAVIACGPVDVSVDPVYADRINIVINDLQLPVPINVITVNIYATTTNQVLSVVVQFNAPSGSPTNPQATAGQQAGTN